MPTVIKLKRGTTTPTTSNIVSGEIAVDTSAQKLYINDASTIKTIGLGNPSVSDISDLTATAAELNILDGVTATTTELNYTDGVTSNIQTQLNAKSPTASPTFTGTPAAPTAAAGTNTTQIATTAFVSTAVSNLVDSAPGTLDTLNELAAALGDDANFSTTVTNSIATKLPLSGGTMSGIIAGFESTGIDDNATSTALTIDSSGNVGIGVSPVAFKLEVQDTSTNSYINVVSSNTNTAGLLLGNSASSANRYQYQIKYDNANDVLTFAGDQGSRTDLQFDTSGNAKFAGDVYLDGDLLEIEQGAAGGDPRLHFLITATAEYSMGIDNSDSDKFKISSGSTVDSGTILTLDRSDASATFAGDLAVGATNGFSANAEKFLVVNGDPDTTGTFVGTHTSLSGVGPAIELNAWTGSASTHRGTRIGAPHDATGGNFVVYTSDTANVGSQTFTEGFRVDGNQNATFAGTLSVNGTQLALSGAGTADRHIEIGVGRTGNGNSYIDLISDTTYTDYGARLIRYNSGANADTRLDHRGTGALSMWATDGGAIQFGTSNTERMRIDSSGNVGIGDATPSYKLDVDGDINYTGTLYNNGVASGSSGSLEKLLIKNSSGTTIKIKVGLNADGTTTNVKNSAGTTLNTVVGPFTNSTNLISDTDSTNSLGKQTIFIPAAAMTPTASNGCSLITTVETTAGRPDMNVLDFGSSSDTHAQFQVAFPKSWNEGVVSFKAYWTVSAAVTTGVAWGLQGVAVSDNDTIDVAYGNPVVVTDDALNTTEDLCVTDESSPLLIAGNPAAEDMVFFRVFRDVSDANDDMTQDARLIGIKLFFTTDAGNDE